MTLIARHSRKMPAAIGVMAALLLFPALPASAAPALPFNSPRQCVPFHGNIICYSTTGVIRSTTTPSGVLTATGFAKYQSEVYFDGALQYKTDSISHFSDVMIKGETQVSVSSGRFAMEINGSICTMQYRIVSANGALRHSSYDEGCASRP